METLSRNQVLKFETKPTFETHAEAIFQLEIETVLETYKRKNQVLKLEQKPRFKTRV